MHYIIGLSADLCITGPLCGESTASWHSTENHSCHYANYVVTGGTVFKTTSTNATSDEKVGILLILSFKCLASLSIT